MNIPVKTAVAVALALTVAHPSPAAASTHGRTGISLTLGYDSFIDKFTIIEEDTSDAVQEFYLSLGSDLHLDGRGVRFDAGNSLRYGNQAISDYFHSSLSAGRDDRVALELRNSLRLKYFQDGSDYEFGNDYIQSNTSARLTRSLGGERKVSLRGRIEHIDYRDRTSFDYDYIYLDGGLEFQAGSYFGDFVRLAGTAGHRSVPDTTDLSYDRFTGETEFHLQLSDLTMAEFSVLGDRREYAGESRSPLWNVYSYWSIYHSTPAGARYDLRIQSESYFYDRPTTTFFDTHFLRGGLRSSFPVADLLSASVEPRIARMFCDDFNEERYWEASMVLGIDLLGGGDHWLNLSWEPGRREYLLAENEIYSDFYFNRLSAMGSLKTPDGSTIGVFVMHDPERHARRDDDFSITMISVTLTRDF